MPNATIPCPRCALELAERTAGRAKLLACRDCGGVWLDRADAERIFEHKPGALQHILLARKIAAKARVGYDIDKPLGCPFDAEPLDKHDIEGVFVDSCRVHGTWFDAGEVQRIANAQTVNPESPPKQEEPEWKPPPPTRAKSGDGSFDLVDAIFAVFDEIDEYRDR